MNTKPSRMHIEPTVRYAIPRNGFLPPIQLVVVITKNLDPPNETTGKS